MYTAFSLIPQWQGPVIAAHLGRIATLGCDDDQASQGRISGRFIDGPTTYQERKRIHFLLVYLEWLTCPLCGIRLTGCNDRKQTETRMLRCCCNILQHKKRLTIWL